MHRVFVQFFLLTLATFAVIGQPTRSAEGSWVGAVSRDGKDWRVILNIENGVATVDFVDLDVVDVAFPLAVSGDKVRLEKPQPNGRPSVVFDGEMLGDLFAGKWSGLGVEGVFSLKRGVRKVKTWREEEVEFQNGDVRLSGTLFLPVTGGKSPAVVITHGSSPNERSGYRSWSRRLAAGGIAALIYDKRGSGGSTGNTRAASMEDLADDALAGVKLLRSRADIDGKRIGVAGHSQGGWIAPLAAARSRAVDFVIVSAAAAVTPAEQSIYHRAGVMREQGISEAEIEQATRLREKLYDLNRKILKEDGSYQKDRAAISQELIANSTARWFAPAELPPQLAGDLPPVGALRLLFFDPVPMWGKVKVPVLALWGENDVVVPVEKSRAIIERTLAKKGNKQLTVKTFPKTDHSNSLVAAKGEWDFPRINLDIDRAMVEWVSRRTI